jgi:hypothetical protein
VARVAWIASVLLLCGCMRGLVYTHVTRPLTTHFDRTPVADGYHAASDVKELRYNAYLRVLWDENSIGSIAKEAGFDEIYYADLETFSVLGIWTQYRVHVYGTKAPNGEAAP